ncbi:MAG: TIR domain-containing protein [Lachnospiraceae bacterium]|nr:TIR domain-containing protein [Lachnospiraceae bacterium]
MQEDKIPKIFISYSWSSDSIVVPLAERLVSHGVDVVLDKWDLKEGQDKYAFMEQCVNDPEITKVLIVCDKKYADKANSRTGGVGDETVIISSEVYGQMKQEKFIPIIAEFDEEGNACVPTYIKSRIYINLADEDKYEEEYEKLLRNIYEKPLYSKPKLGSRPEWIDEENKNLFPLIDLVRQIKGSKSEKKQNSCVAKFIEEYVEMLKTYNENGSRNGKQTYDCFIEMKQIRDVFLDFLSALAETELNFADIVSEAFERMYNTLTTAKGFNPDAMQACDSDYEIYKIHIWELFICVMAFLRHTQNYKMINELLNHTYFLTTSCLSDDVKPANYCRFRFHSRLIEEQYKPTTSNKDKFTLIGHILCTEREKRPIYTGEAIAEADLFLYQVTKAYQLAEDEHQYREPYWFPTCYVYVKTWPKEWIKMKSRKYCEKMYDLFAVKSVDELKEKLKDCTSDREMRYNGSFDSAPAILNCVKLEEIGSLN